MVRLSRTLYVVLAWAFVVGLTVQVFLIGAGIFGASSSGFDLHAAFGWILHLFPLLILVFAYLSRGGRLYWGWAAVLALVVFVVPLLATARTSAPIIAALHPVVAMISYAIAVIVAVSASRLSQRRDAVQSG